MKVEDGTGLSNSNSYVSLEESDEIISIYGLDWPEGANIEASLIVATEYIDSSVRFVSSLLNDEQSLSFPRKPFYDREGRKVEGVPFEIKKAVVFLAIENSRQPLNKTRAALRSQRFGDSQETYAGVFVEDSEIQSILKRLFSLGYGSRLTSVVTVERA